MVDLRPCNTGRVAFTACEATEGSDILISCLAGEGDAAMVLSLFLVASALLCPPMDEVVGRILLEVVWMLLGRALLVVHRKADFVGLTLLIRLDTAPCSPFVARFSLSA